MQPICIAFYVILIRLILLPLIAVDKGYIKRKAAKDQYLLTKEIPFFS